MIDELLLGPWSLKPMKIDLRHQFLESARERRICVICLKDKDHADHVSEEVAAQVNHDETG